MNNLSGFTDVINGIRQAIFSLNSQLVQLKSEVEQLKAKAQQEQNTSSHVDSILEVKHTVGEWREQSHENIRLLQGDVEQLKQHMHDVAKLCETKLCSCNSTCQEQSCKITEADIQIMIDKSLSALLEGVQPLTSLNLETLADIQAPPVVVEPPVIAYVNHSPPEETTAPSVATPLEQTPTVPPKTTKRTYKKKTT